MAIFGNPGQALHFAYTLEAYEGSPPSIMAITVQRLMKELGIWDEKKRPGPAFDLAGLTSPEVYTQCTDIRVLVRRLLRPFDAMLIEARYSSDTRVKPAAVRHIAEFFRPSLGIGRDLALCLAWRHYQPKARQDSEWSFRTIGDEYGVPKSTVERQFKRMAQMIQAMECIAIDHLRDHFETAGITETLNSYKIS